jgi:hypothetical protein
MFGGAAGKIRAKRYNHRDHRGHREEYGETASREFPNLFAFLSSLLCVLCDTIHQFLRGLRRFLRLTTESEQKGITTEITEGTEKNTENGKRTVSKSLRISLFFPLCPL